MSKCSPTEAAKVDKIMYEVISDLAAVQRMLWSLELHRPVPNCKATKPGPDKFSDKSSENEFYWRGLSEQDIREYVKLAEARGIPRGKVIKVEQVPPLILGS